MAKSGWLSQLDHFKVSENPVNCICLDQLEILRFFQCMLKMTVMQRFSYLPRRKLRSFVILTPMVKCVPC